MSDPSERLFVSSEVLHGPTENPQEFTEMPHQKKKSRFSRMCGECVHCLRKEDCGECDFCQVLRSPQLAYELCHGKTCLKIFLLVISKEGVAGQSFCVTPSTEYNL